MRTSILCLVLFIYGAFSSYPNVIFHGIGDSCSNSGMADFTKTISQLTGAYSLCVALGTDQSTFSWFDPLDEQSNDACSIIAGDSNIGDTFNVIGLSQGGVIARYIIERCNLTSRVSKLLSIGGPQMGTNSIPRCADTGIMCSIVNGVTRGLVYTSWVQEHVAPAGYFKDMNKYQEYLEKATFLPYLNNEKPDSVVAEYASRMQALDGVMLVMFATDSVLDPPSTAWFSYYNAQGKIIDMVNQPIYQEDLIGLKTLNEQGKIQFVSLPGDHLSFSQDNILNIFVPFLV